MSPSKQRSAKATDVVPGVVEPIQDRSKLSTRRLLEAAGELIAERGFEQASLAAIGDRAGYSRGLVTTRFGTKENLLTVLMQRITSDWIADNVLPELEGLSGLDAMLTYLDRYIEQLERDPEPTRVLWALSFEALRTSSPLREHFEPHHRATVATVRGFLVQGIDDGSIDPGIDPAHEALMHTAMLRGIAHQWLLVGDDAQVVEMLRSFRERAARDYQPTRTKARRTQKP